MTDTRPKDAFSTRGPWEIDQRSKEEDKKNSERELVLYMQFSLPNILGHSGVYSTVLSAQEPEKKKKK